MKASFQSLFFICISAIFLFGCTINQKKRFDQVQVGMEKDQVLGLLASPQRNERRHGMDRWTYIFFDDDVRFEKEIHFTDGKAAYVGDVAQPALSADERDKKNDEANAELEKNYQTKRQENRKSYEDYENNVQGTESQRFVPVFKPIQ